jgi:hypothetical protein
MAINQFRVQADYRVPLLRLLANMPGGGGTKREALERFWERYESYIPPADREEVPSGGGVIRWMNKVAWCRADLTDLGFVDRSTRNVWTITQAGRDWLAQNPDATHVDRAQRSSAGIASRAAPVRRRAPVLPPGITLEKLERIRQIIPLQEFRQDWGDLYDYLLAEERARAITPVNDKLLANRVRPLVQRIQDFLQGRGNDTPKSEVVCDWIFVCYNLELFREGAALWQYVNKDETNPWQHERTMRLSAACRTRIG